MPSESDNVNQLLVDWGNGNQQALEELLPLIYNELRHLAHNFLYRERPGHTLQTTALVHEAYLKLIDQRDARWQNRSHFFAIAAQAMRRILIDSARKHAAAKRGGPQEKLALDEAATVSLEPDRNLLALDEALKSLAVIDPQQERLVELRYFGGLTIEETAEVMDLSPATIKREWAMARAWLHQELTERRLDGT
ncbi:MAG TPA: RNA polymerase subunit sigma-70 [Blastocatellia bacterium]|jgi:RNA polymerase sigma factor (TIGR02999 family)|nr:RNA polymerase subunit sigma-70 [Blastocatellia bacterium]HAF22204.1 RNA polymerase subunit sigma-70 [Blastocatellia bacterium]